MARHTRGQPTQTIDIAGVSVRVTRKRIKTLRLTVHSPDGDVRVSAPLSIPMETIRAFVESRLDWVERHRARIRAAPKPDNVDYVSGEQLPFDGHNYPLLVVHVSGRPRVTLRDGELLVMSVPPDADRSQRERAMQAWYRRHLEAVVPPMIAAWESRLGVSVAEWRIRRMKTRWGTCSIRARRIWLNLDLATKPRDCLEYLIVHEMVHLLEPSHNARFKALMDRHLPNWRDLRKRLNQGHLRQDD